MQLAKLKRRIRELEQRIQILEFRVASDKSNPQLSPNYKPFWNSSGFVPAPTRPPIVPAVVHTTADGQTPADDHKTTITDTVCRHTRRSPAPIFLSRESR
jgi:hypothetical protein